MSDSIGVPGQGTRAFAALLQRFLSPEERGRDAKADGFAFALEIETIWEKDEPGRCFSALATSFGGMLVGIGSNHERAVNDLLDAVQGVLDHHIELGTYEEFMDERFEQRFDLALRGEGPTFPETCPWLRHVEPLSTNPGRSPRVTERVGSIDAAAPV